MVTLLPAVRSLQITISGSDPERSVDLAQAEMALLGQLPARSSQKTHVNVPRIREPYPRPSSVAFSHIAGSRPVGRAARERGRQPVHVRMDGRVLLHQPLVRERAER